MAWIESHQNLRTHPKTGRLARALGISRACAIGTLHLLWWWALDHAQDGDLGDMNDADLADGAAWEGEADLLVAALYAAGFLDPDRRLHDWEDYAGRLLDQRAQARERARLHRERTRTVRARPANLPERTRLPDRTGTKTGTKPEPETGGNGAAAAALAPCPQTELPLGPVALAPLSTPQGITAQVVDKLQAAGLTVTLTRRDRETLQGAHPDPAEVAQAYQELAAGAWGDAFDRDKLSISYVVEHLNAWRQRRRSPERDPKRFLTGKYGHVVNH